MAIIGYFKEMYCKEDDYHMLENLTGISNLL